MFKFHDRDIIPWRSTYSTSTKAILQQKGHTIDLKLVYYSYYQPTTAKSTIMTITNSTKQCNGLAAKLENHKKLAVTECTQQMNLECQLPTLITQNIKTTATKSDTSLQHYAHGS